MPHPKSKEPSAEPAEESAGTHRSRLLFEWAAGILLFATLVVMVLRRKEEVRFVDLLHHAQPWWLLVAAVLQVATYACAAGAWRVVLARQGKPQPLWRLIPLGLAKLFMDQMVPSAGLSGTLLVVRALERRGVPHGVSASAVIMGLLGFYAAYGIALVAALTVLWLSGELSPLVLTLAFTATLLIGAMIGAGFWLSKRSRGPVLKWLSRLPLLRRLMKVLHDAPREALRDRRLLLETTAFQLGIFLLDTATLSVCLASIGASAKVTGVFASFVTASLVATLTIIPSGLGTFDATLLGMLHVFGVPTTSALGAILLFRGFTLMLPLIPGLWLARKEMRPAA